ERVRHCNLCSCGRSQADSSAEEVSDNTVLDDQRPAGLEQDPGRARTGAVDEQATQADSIARAGVDDDAVLACAHRNSCEIVTLYADRLGNRQGAVTGGIEHVDLTLGGHHVMRMLERPARQRERARVAIAALRRDEDARRLRMRRTSD